MIYEILQELNLENGANYKKAVLKKYKDNLLLQRVLKMALDKVIYTYGITMKNVVSPNERMGMNSLNSMLDVLESEFVTRKTTGNVALEMLGEMLRCLSEEDAKVIELIINRDLKIRLGRSEVNKVFPGLIVKPPYTRCEIGTEANVKKNINFKQKVYSQVKMDGTFRRAVSDSGEIEITSRPGIESSFPLIEEQLKLLKTQDVVFIGEMTLEGEKDRKKGNGLINSDDVPHDDIIFTIWDMIPIHEYSMTKVEVKQAEKDGTLSLYEDRFEALQDLLLIFPLSNVKLIEYKIVKNMKEAFEHFQEVTKLGGEGTVIKSHDMTHKDGNSKKQLKVKLEIELDVRITSFNPGNKGSKNEHYFSGINFSNDDGTIQGTVGVTTLTEAIRDWFHKNRNKVQDNVMTLICNDVDISRENDFYTLSHSRYQELRGHDKITDSLERALEQKQMAMEQKARVR